RRQRRRDRPVGRAAIAAMEQGGSAADGAIAAALTAGVVSPVSSGMGGGGFAMVLDAATGKVTVLDFRESAPAAYDADAADAKDAPTGTSVGVPGEVAGLFELHRRHGRRPWATTVEEVARLAEQGFTLTPHMARALAKMGKAVPPGTMTAALLPGGTPLTAGATLREPVLAASLREVAKFGPTGFYGGRIGRSFVATARRAGSTLTEADLTGYKVIEREPLHIRWGEHDVYAMPPPSAGGLMLMQALAMFSPAEAARELDPTKPAGAHTLAEVFRGAMADRTRTVGDPGLTPVDTGALLDPARLRARRQGIASDRTRPVASFVREDHGTSHLVVSDAQGNVVSLTTTVNSPFGARVRDEDTGLVLNDELHDFIRPAAVAALGLATIPGSGRPGARPPSSMTPVIARGPAGDLVSLGGSGGMRIATSVTLVTLGMLASGLGAEEAVKRPRVHIAQDGSLLLEPGAMTADERADLERRGEKVREEEAMNGVQALRRGPRVEAAADPRKFGLAVRRAKSGS
ncbi:MAG: hypothetical protein EOO75_10840, partial [Myxococcales bacterium]